MGGERQEAETIVIHYHMQSNGNSIDMERALCQKILQNQNKLTHEKQKQIGHRK